MHANVSLIARVLLSAIFLAAGVHKFLDYDTVAAYMANGGVTPSLLPAVIAFQLIAGGTLLAGAYARISALALAGYTLVAALIFHTNFADPIQIAMFMKNLAITGGLLLVFANGPGGHALNDK